jgi:EXLDI family protein
MPNKTIYVSDDDLKLVQRAQELAGSLSAAIVTALRRYVDAEEGRLEGYDEITVKVGPGPGRKQRFMGLLLGEWGRTVKQRTEIFKVYKSRTGKFVVHTERSADWAWSGSEAGNWRENWRAHLGIGDQYWGSSTGERSLQVADTLDKLRELIPAELFDMVESAAKQPPIEDLDI